ncbi:hypothetical protein PG991_011280 [Apiospora marii]|uniref:Uncharacterized protein n=1 Tax=Apiospora marii TaxID=335849 RepID=A0ABR1RDR5_9PEZI
MPETYHALVQPWKPKMQWFPIMIFDVFLVLGALAFLFLAALAVSLQGRPALEGIGPAVETAMTLGPTVFPILFAALVGRMLRHLGRYYVERGLKMRILWRLMNIRTVFDSVTSPFQLREISVVAVLLIVLWSLSPLGSQAVLRLVHHFNETSTEIVPLRYVDLGPGGSLVVRNYYLYLFKTEVPLAVDYTFGSALLQNQEVKEGPRDNWGNVKIPRIERLDESSADDEGWLQMSDHNRTAETYSALMGIPIVGIPRQGSANMSLESSYVSLSCEPTAILRDGPLQYGLIARCDDCEYDGMFGTADQESGRSNIFLGYSDLSETEKRNASFTAPRRITFLSGSGQTVPLPGEVGTDFNVTTSTTCAATQSLVESKVSCEDGACMVTAMRWSKTDLRNPNFTVFDHWAVAVLEQISKQFVRSRSFSQSSNILEYFLNDSSKIPVYEVHKFNPSANNTLVDLSRVPSQLVAERAAMALNTYIQLFYAPMAFAGDLPSGNLSLYGPDHIPAKGVDIIDATFAGNCKVNTSSCFPGHLENTLFFGASVNAVVTHKSNLYKSNWPWISILFVASTTLIVGGIVGIVLGVQAKAPDMFDPVVGLTYHNKHLGATGLSGPLDVTERARSLGDEVVRLGDAQAEDTTGKIVFGISAEVGELQRDRLYV